MSGVRGLMGEWPVIWIERSRGWASAAESTGWSGAPWPEVMGCGVHSGRCTWPCAWCSMSSGPTEGCLVLLFCWRFFVVVFNKCLLSSLCYLTFTFGCWYQAEFPSPPTCSAHPEDLRCFLQLWFIVHTSQDRGFCCPHSSQQPLGSAETGSTRCDPC